MYFLLITIFCCAHHAITSPTPGELHQSLSKVGIPDTSAGIMFHSTLGCL